MAVKLSQISGALVEKVEVVLEHDRGFNYALIKQGEIAIGMNRERLAKKLHYMFGVRDCNGKLMITWKNIKEDKGYFNNWLGRAEVIIKELPTLLEAQ